MAELKPTEATLRTYLQVLRRRLPLVIAVTILSVGISVALSLVQTKEYSGAAQLLVQPANSDSALISGTQQRTISPTDVLTELQLLTSAPVRTKAASQLGFEPSVSASQVGQTNVISVTATAKTPALAARSANTYAKTFVAQQRTNAINELISGEKQYQDQINTINSEIQALSKSTSPTASSTIAALVNQEAVLKGDEAQLEVAAAATPGGVEIAALASKPLSPSSPKPLKDGVIALVVGLLLGLGAAFLVDYFDDTVYTKEELERVIGGVPVLAMIPKIRGSKKSDRVKLIAKEDPYSPVTESYRSLGISLQFAWSHAPRTVLITSPAGTEGKTSTVANLGVVLANTGKSVVVVGCDLRRPRIDEFLGLPEASGFTSVVLRQDDLTSAVRPLVNTPELALLGTGPVPPNAAGLLGSSNAAEVLSILAREFDVVLIDSPPLLVADALVLSGHADAILLVVAAGQTKTRQVKQALEQLSRVNADRVGIVLNKVVRRSTSGRNNAFDKEYRRTTPPSPEIHVAENGQVGPLTAQHRH
jgi:tyrosine-protein kinase